MKKLLPFIIIPILIFITSCTTQSGSDTPPPTREETAAAYSKYQEVEPDDPSVPEDFAEAYRELAQDKDIIKVYWRIGSYKLAAPSGYVDGKITHEIEERVKQYLPINADNVKAVAEPDAADFIIEVNIINTYKKDTGVAVLTYKYTYSLIESATKIIHAEDTFITTFARIPGDPDSTKLLQYGWR
jgi:hypothetical protein